MGLVALRKGDKAAAETYLGKASGTKELNEALGNLYIAQGQYDRAVTHLATLRPQCSFGTNPG